MPERRAAAPVYVGAHVWIETILQTPRAPYSCFRRPLPHKTLLLSDLFICTQFVALICISPITNEVKQHPACFFLGHRIWTLTH